MPSRAGGEPHIVASMKANGHASSRRIPSLDGVRAISILLVLYSHWGLTDAVPFLHRLPARQFAYFGSLGVSIFFVISGFLITALLMAEKEKSATVSLKNFYIRRVLRIFPAYYVYLFVILVLTVTGTIAVSSRDLVWSALYIRDYSAQTTAWTNHTWSLAVEEQFYLLWPLLVLLLNKRRLVTVCFVVIVISPFIRVFTYVLTPGMRDLITVMFHTRADTLMIGCLLALTRFDGSALRVKELFIRYNGPLLAAVMLFILSPLIYGRFHDGYLMTIGYTIDNACIALLLIWTVDHRETLTGRILNWSPIRRNRNVVVQSVSLARHFHLTAARTTRTISAKCYTHVRRRVVFVSVYRDAIQRPAPSFWIAPACHRNRCRFRHPCQRRSKRSLEIKFLRAGFPSRLQKWVA